MAAEWLRRLAAGDALLGGSLLIVAAHPDDEVIGLGAQLPRLKGVQLLHVTDGAPRNLLDARSAGFDSWQEYAGARRAELLAALALAGIGPAQACELGIPDQAASLQLIELTEALAAHFGELRPTVVMTHPYEGGHPDHDATAFAVHAACALMRRRGGCGAPAIIEMTSYHAGPRGRVMCEFLPRPRIRVTTIALDGDRRAFKQRLVACFPTQKHVLADLPIEIERFRPAPTYDFTRPPHRGPLLYEHFDWGMEGARWRALAAEALAACDLARTP